MSKAIVKQIPSGPFATNAYVVACAEKGEAAIIDPGVESARKIQTFMEKEGVKPIGIFLTHSHWDHIGDASALKETYAIPIAIHSLDRANLEAPGSDGLPMLAPITPASADCLIDDGDILSVGILAFRVIHTPGHTPGGVCFYSQEAGILLSGDTLFKQSIGNLALPTANAEAMWPSLKKLEALPSETVVYPGHGSITTLAAEHDWLPYARRRFF